jgi:hypothetical protein
MIQVQSGASLTVAIYIHLPIFFFSPPPQSFQCQKDVNFWWWVPKENKSSCTIGKTTTTTTFSA